MQELQLYSTKAALKFGLCFDFKVYLKVLATTL